MGADRTPWSGLAAVALLITTAPGSVLARQTDPNAAAPAAGDSQAGSAPNTAPPPGTPTPTPIPPSTAPPTPPPDKSGFNLFNPTPAADLRGFCTDRPTKSTGPCTVDAGYFQIESDVFNVTIDHSRGVAADTWLITNPTLKLGLTNTLDFELNMAPYEIITTRDRVTGATMRQSGVGDLFLRFKWALLGDDGGKVAFALVPYVKIPTAPLGIGNGAVEGGLIAPVNVNLPLGWSVTIDPEVDLLENASGQGTHINTSGLLSFSRAVSKQVTFSAEIWSDVNFEPLGTVTQVSADLGLAWIPASQPTLQFDGGVNLGLNRQTPGAQLYVGISHRF